MNCMNPSAKPSDSFTAFSARFHSWRDAGLSVRAAAVLANAGCNTVADVATLGRAYFVRCKNCGTKTLHELSRLAGWPPERATVVDAISAALSLAIHDPAEAREAAVDVAIALRRSGFTIAARGSAAL